MKFRRFLVSWVFCTLVLLLSGCVRTPTGTVEGVVTFQGKPLETGEIVFLSLDRMHTSGGILEASGHYKLLSPLPVGEYKVAVAPPAPPSNPEGSDPPKASFPLPESYHSPGKSGLTFSVVKGRNTANFDLTE